MNSYIFNFSLLLGLILIMVGMGGLHSVWAGLLTGGVVVVAVTLLLARWAGVATPRKG